MKGTEAVKMVSDSLFLRPGSGLYPSPFTGPKHSEICGFSSVVPEVQVPFVHCTQRKWLMLMQQQDAPPERECDGEALRGVLNAKRFAAPFEASLNDTMVTYSAHLMDSPLSSEQC